jgi:hypothetical protein
MLTHYNCTEWAPPPVADANALDDPAQEHDDNMLALFPVLHVTFSILCVFRRMRKMARLLLASRSLSNDRSQSRSRPDGFCIIDEAPSAY